MDKLQEIIDQFLRSAESYNEGGYYEEDGHGERDWGKAAAYEDAAYDLQYLYSQGYRLVKEL